MPLDHKGYSDSDSVLGARFSIDIVLHEGEECHVRSKQQKGKFLEKGS